jgi:hypothetical protein
VIFGVPSLHVLSVTLSRPATLGSVRSTMLMSVPFRLTNILRLRYYRVQRILRITVI